EMVWSTSRVAAETLRRCTALDLRTCVVTTWPDIDDAPALRRLIADLAAAPSNVAPHTRAVLHALVLDSPFDVSIGPTTSAPQLAPATSKTKSTTPIQETATR